MNLFDARLNDDATIVTLGSQSISLPKQVAEQRPRLVEYAGRDVVVGLRPEDLPAAEGSTPSGQGLKADVVLVEALGSEMLVHFSVDAQRVHVDEVQEDPGDIAENSELAVLGQGIARVHPRTVAAVGDRIELQVHAERMHFFDPHSQMSIRD
jgi:multiple sugar transport system ATP-binding protein